MASPVIPITITRLANGKIEPKNDNARTSNRTTRVRPNEKVRFGADPATPGVQGGRVRFQSESPFGGNLDAKYGDELTVSVLVKPGGAANNRYPYTCCLTINGQEVCSDGGGEMEVGPNG